MLTVLQEQLGDAHGLAMAAGETVDRVEARVADERLLGRLDELRQDADETRARCLEAEAAFGEELAEELVARANTVGERAADLATAWFKAGTSPLAAWSFLAMGEAAEVATWSALRQLAGRERALVELADWGLGMQSRHLALVLEGMPLLAQRFEPSAPRFG
jgi:hypothetical protein